MSHELSIGLKLAGMVAVIFGVVAVLVCAARANGHDCECDRCRAKDDGDTSD